MNFEEFNLSDSVLSAIYKKGFEKPTYVQEKVIPLMLSKKGNIIAQSKTGTGKTASFGIPLIELLKPKKYVQALILTPTRELSLQVAEEISSLKGKKRLKIFPVYGGQSINYQIQHLKRGVDVVVGTPGRILDHINRKTLDISKVEYFVLDEADEMLNMGFIDDVERIMENASDDKKILLFSATMPSRIISLAKKYMGTYEFVKATDNQLTVNLTEQIYIEVYESEKFEVLCRVIDATEEFYGLVFCRTKLEVDEVSNRLIERGYDAEALHGDFSQYQRERVLKKFRTRKVNILIATDVAARGIDIGGLSHVINYSIPLNPEYYVHRIGRTGRAGKEGVAITFVTPKEYRELFRIKKFSNARIKKGEIPTIEEVLSAKLNKIKKFISNRNEVKDNKVYKKLTKELLSEYSTEEVVEGLLKYILRGSISEIFQDLSQNRKFSEKVRLFIARGKNSGMDKAKLVRFISERAGINDKIIRDVQLYDKFSFITVPYREAEIILEAFKVRGRRSIVSKAREKSKSKFIN
ncbi:DEAD/DEAH box helicase [Thermosipho ferrireducens]|uniref:DEAD/DEAH box helicase n=1 Tax=Thermosipho ferrireducens TaxID=2571116 RepID=A0ABX7S741_9BACT|nr:DEAD/DEAH box helicase [Thermosipho ferrireducens]QTA38411.1 DEAD/DEAH box helicase [Thermosipho ferrireducens]